MLFLLVLLLVLLLLFLSLFHLAIFKQIGLSFSSFEESSVRQRLSKVRTDSNILGETYLAWSGLLLELVDLFDQFDYLIGVLNPSVGFSERELGQRRCDECLGHIVFAIIDFLHHLWCELIILVRAPRLSDTFQKSLDFSIFWFTLNSISVGLGQGLGLGHLLHTPKRARFRWFDWGGSLLISSQSFAILYRIVLLVRALTSF